MEEDWTGKAVSIECDEKLGVFQGIIKSISATQITIIRAFRNGVPMRKQDAEVTLRSADIRKIKFIPAYDGQNSFPPIVINKPTPVKQPNFAAPHFLRPWDDNKQESRSSPAALATTMSSMNLNSNEMKSTPNSSCASNDQYQWSKYQVNKASPPTLCNNSVATFFGNLVPPKVEAHMTGAFTACSNFGSPNVHGTARGIALASGAGNGFHSGNGIASGNTIATGSKIAAVIGVPSENVIESRNGFVSENVIETGNPNTSSNAMNGFDFLEESTNGENSPQRIDVVKGRGIYNLSNYGAVALPNSNGYSNSKLRYLNGCNNGSGKKPYRKQLRRENSFKQEQTFATSVDDPILHEDFDFEGNLALFDKKAVWNVIEATTDQNFLRESLPPSQVKYRHDENILVSEPPQLRQIETAFESCTDFVTDEGLIIPTIPMYVRSKIELIAKKAGLSLQRQIDILARGATDLAILLLGGARRLTPNNSHQWPKIAIICEKSDHFRTRNIGAAVGRQLAAHGLKVILYLEEDPDAEKKSVEISLFKATDNAVVYTTSELPKPDLVIICTPTVNLSEDVKKWLSENRASVFAIDPPAYGIRDVLIKYAILPILPLNGISSVNCGKLYLCNLGIPDKYYRDAGIKYKSPFGHKFVIPIHLKD